MSMNLDELIAYFKRRHALAREHGAQPCESFDEVELKTILDALRRQRDEPRIQSRNSHPDAPGVEGWTPVGITPRRD